MLTVHQPKQIILIGVGLTFSDPHIIDKCTGNVLFTRTISRELIENDLYFMGENDTHLIFIQKNFFIDISKESAQQVYDTNQVDVLNSLQPNQEFIKQKMQAMKV